MRQPWRNERPHFQGGEKARGGGGGGGGGEGKAKAGEERDEGVYLRARGGVIVAWPAYRVNAGFLQIPS